MDVDVEKVFCRSLFKLEVFLASKFRLKVSRSKRRREVDRAAHRVRKDREPCDRPSAGGCGVLRGRYKIDDDGSIGLGFAIVNMCHQHVGHIVDGESPRESTRRVGWQQLKEGRGGCLDGGKRLEPICFADES